MLSEQMCKIDSLSTYPQKNKYVTLQRLILLLEVTNIHLLSGPFKRSA